MKCTSISSLLVSVFVVAAFASCGRRDSADHPNSGEEQPTEGNIVLADIGGQRVTAADFRAELARRGWGMPRTEAQRRQLLDDLVTFQVMLRRAKAAGFDRTPAMQDQIDRLIVARFQERELPPAPTSPPGDAELRAFYDGHQAQFATPAEVRAGLIYFACSPKAEPGLRAEQRHQAEAILADARSADDRAFASLAQKHSADQATRYRGGDTGWVQADGDALPWPAAVIHAAAALQQSGECAPLVETPTGFYVVRLLGRKPGGVRAFADVKDVVAYDFSQHQREAQQQRFLEDMKRDLRITIHPERLQQLSVPEPAVEVPPAVPGS